MKNNKNDNMEVKMNIAILGAGAMGSLIWI